MNDGFLSQDEINSLLNGENSDDSEFIEEDKENVDEVMEDAGHVEEETLSDLEKDLLGEIGNISMGSASTALSNIIKQQVNITTPVVSATTLNKLKNTFEVPNIALEVKYTSGILGENLLVMKITDAAVVANLMMGGDGIVKDVTSLSEIEVSAVSEAMNQMIGSSATSMATMLGREVNISPPISKIWDDLTSPLSENIDENETIIKVSFKLNIGTLVDSQIMQLLPMEMAKKIVAIMMGEDIQEEIGEEVMPEIPQVEETQHDLDITGGEELSKTQVEMQREQATYTNESPTYHRETPRVQEKPIEVQEAIFQPLQQTSKGEELPRNIDLIMDVPLDISVVLGRTKLNIKEILNLGTGSLIELDKLAEEPVEILVNGKPVAFGEVVVIDENFGVRITDIVNNVEKIKSLGGK
ncbi:flagellar motor switch phosphatase FliY [Clostridium tetani]|uniref:flagellar motor switch phosphatase FliY n=1 Tax=Clostridium tetani TaxID=1513 RepID=UPI000513FEB2|nr:flagellar motor switch phosphatase FliY [Clostridium tetani]KGI39703.1 flagellar motor switch protein [Clostridium tetani ATCC 9441]KHO31796.1 flagellar motor switch protein [Clostridium tetani]WFN61067.1 flagellar motor switch phosphatase FliY [Clostridium tetani]SUY56321.1 flagellar motor switch protein [Clostridium tetani]SUY66815.1 flagellar motor switch protein [Clostridium tetani]